MSMWTNLISTTGSVWANSVYVSTKGSVYVAGGTGGNLSSEEKSGYYQAFLGKFNTDGSEAWMSVKRKGLSAEPTTPLRALGGWRGQVSTAAPL